MTSLSEIITDEEIARVHGFAHFGATTPREVVNEGVRKSAVGHHCGSTQLAILREHGLVTKPRPGSSDVSLTKKGKRYARAMGRNDAELLEVSRRNMADTWAAMCAMRDTINELIPLPSIESDLLQGPEASVFCSVVAERVVEVAWLLRLYQIVHGTMTVEELEWSGTRTGQGFGPHGSGPGGTEYDACPVCHGLRRPNGDFIASAVGHQPGCTLAAFLRPSERVGSSS